MDINDGVIAYLKGKTGGKLVMTPKQLEEEIGKSVKQQSDLRIEGRFPIPHKKIGKSVVYSIFDVADFLVNGETKEEVKKVEKEEAQPAISLKPKRVTKKQGRQYEDVSHIFTLRRFAENVQKQADFFNEFTKVISSYTMATELENELTKK